MAQESKLQTKIREDLEKSGWVVNKIILSSKKGWPDLEAFRNKVAIFIEAKAEGKKADPLQLLRHEQLNSKGFSVFVIDSWADYLSVKETIENL